MRRTPFDLSSLELIKLSSSPEFAPGIPAAREIKALPEITTPKTWHLAVQKHDADKAGTHFDLRLVDPETGHAHSWALPKAVLPAPGKSVLAVPQATHTRDYALNFGKKKPEVISEGYGKGTVSMHMLHEADVFHSKPEESGTRVRFNLYKSTGPEEYAIVRTKGDNDILVNKTLTRERMPHLDLGGKPKSKEHNIDEINVEDMSQVLMPKYDGAHTLLDLQRAGKIPRLFSYREPKRHLAGVIEHTHKVPELLEMRVPAGLGGTTLRAETIGVTSKGKAIPARDIAGMLNATVTNSRAKQEEMGAVLKPVIFDIIRYKGRDVSDRPFSARKELMKTVGDQLGIAVSEVAETAHEKRKLLQKIRSGKHKLTGEGVVIRHLESSGPAIKAKIRPDHDVYVRKIFEAQTAAGQGTGRAGGIEYSWTPRGDIVGRVGTGWDHAEAKAMLAEPEKYIGRVAKVEAETKYPSGALGKASFKEWHLDKGAIEKVGASIAEYVAGGVLGGLGGAYLDDENRARGAAVGTVGGVLATRPLIEGYLALKDKLRGPIQRVPEITGPPSVKPSRVPQLAPPRVNYFTGPVGEHIARDSRKYLHMDDPTKWEPRYGTIPQDLHDLFSPKELHAWATSIPGVQRYSPAAGDQYRELSHWNVDDYEAVGDHVITEALSHGYRAPKGLPVIYPNVKIRPAEDPDWARWDAARYPTKKASYANAKTADHIGDRFLHGDEKGPRTSLPIEHLTALREAVAKANEKGDIEKTAGGARKALSWIQNKIRRGGVPIRKTTDLVEGAGAQYTPRWLPDVEGFSPGEIEIPPFEADGKMPNKAQDLYAATLAHEYGHALHDQNPYTRGLLPVGTIGSHLVAPVAGFGLGVTHKPEDSTNKELAGSAALGGVPISLVEGEAWRQGTPLWNQYSAKYIPTARGTQHYYHTLNALNLGVQGVTGAAKAGIGYGAGRGARYLYDKATAAWHTPSEKTADHIGDRFLHGDEKGPRTSLPIEHLTALRDAVAKANATGIDHLPEKFRLPLPDGSHAIVEKYPGTGLSLKTLLSPTMKSREPVVKLEDLHKAPKPAVDLKDWEALNPVQHSPVLKAAEVQTELQPHQQRVLDRIQHQPGLVVAHGLGSGKTLSSIAAAEQLGGATDVVLPAALKANYQKELEKHIAGTPNAQYNLQSLQGLARSGISPQGQTLIIDEAHRLRNPGTKGYKAIQAAPAAHRLLLTGTPLYNRPHDLAVLVNLAAGENVLPNSEAAFKAKYLGEKQVHPSWWAEHMQGIHPGTVPIVTNKRELAPILQKWVDYHENAREGFPQREDIEYKVPMDPGQQSVYEGVLESAPGWISHKIKHNLPPSKSESKDLNAFLTAARQVSNTPHQYDVTQNENVQAGRVSPKIWKAYQEFQRQMAENPEHRAVIYSNYLESGLNPYAKLLEKKHVPYGMFTGDVDKTTRDQMVKDYNLGKLKALLLSSAGGEGLDLKNTRQIQILDPHFNKEKLEQVIGRGIRYKSHEALPEDQRKVRVEQYLSTLPEAGPIAQFFGQKSDTSIDQYLQQMARNKDALNQQMRDLLKAKEGDRSAAPTPQN